MFSYLGQLVDAVKTQWFHWVVTTVVERIPVLKQLFALIDGHKEDIGRAMMAITILIGALQTIATKVYPDTAFAIDVDQINVWYAGIAGWLMTELGLQHQEVKARRMEIPEAQQT